MDNEWIAQYRLRNQRINRPGELTAFDVVRRLGAIQAQDYSQALWAVGLRMQQAHASEVEYAIAEKKIVLTWAMRGTLHLVTAEDVHWMIKLLTPRILSKNQPKLKQMELDSKLLSYFEELIYQALKEKKRMNRADLMALLEDTGFVTKNGRGYFLLWYLAQIGLICLGPLEGKQQTFVLLEDWLPNQKRYSMEESLKEITERYFTGHGPATVHDFAWWSGLTVTEARNGIEAANMALHSEKIEGVEYWMGQDSAKGNESGVYLLPGFDEYLLGYKDRSAVLENKFAPFIVPGNNGVFKPMLIVDGQIEGTWSRQIKKGGVEISVSPFSSATPWSAESLDQSIQRYRKFVEAF